MARSSAARSAGPGCPPSSTPMTVCDEQGLAGQRVRPGPGARYGRGQVEGVEPHPVGAQMQVGAASARGEAGVFVFGVDDPALGALVGVAQHFELGQVGLPRAGGGEGDGVVVVLRPPVPGDQARPGGVRAVEDAGQRVRVGGVAGQVGGGERERRRQRRGVHRPGQLEVVGAGREGGDPALQGPEGGRGGDQQQRAGDRADRRDLLRQLVFAAGVDGEVQAEAEQLPLTAGQPVRQVPRVICGGFGVRVIELPAVRPGAAPGFQPGPLPAQPVRRRGRGDGVDVQGDVEAAGVRQQRLQPPGSDLGGVAGDREGRGVVVADPQVPGGDLHVRRPGHRVRGGVVRGAPGAAAQGAGEVMAGSRGW